MWSRFLGSSSTAASLRWRGSGLAARLLRSLRRLRDRLGHQFLGGVVLYTGVRSYTDERVHIVPVSRLWRAA